MRKNILLKIAYDGSAFHGWQKQPGILTVQGYLEETIGSLLGEDISLSGTSRTDAGVHSYGQMASFITQTPIPEERLKKVINNALDRDASGRGTSCPVRIVSATGVQPDFHARFDSKGKKYIYKIRQGEPDVFLRNYRYFIDRPLNVNAMCEAASCLKGRHDFKSFEAAGGNPRATTVRTIFDTRIFVRGLSEDRLAYLREFTGDFAGGFTEHGSGDGTALPIEINDQTAEPSTGLRQGRQSNILEGADIEIHISGNGFLYNMVRIIAGTLVEAGLGKLPPEHIKDIIEAKDRTRAGHTAPPGGLFLAEVYY